MSEAGFDPAQFVGRFHPILVHLPIGFLLLLVMLEGIALIPRFKHVSGGSRVILLLSAPLAIGTSLTGWLLADGGGYDATLLQWHRWTGVGVAVATLVLLGLHLRGWGSIYRGLLVVTAVLVAVAGHFGGSLTHGSDYLAAHAPEPLKRWLGGRPAGSSHQDGSAFALGVQPVLNRYCVSCHGAEKSKAGLRMDTHELLLKGGDNGPVIVAGQPDESDLLKRVLLPADNDDHMPPDGKPQPTTDDIALLRWWIESGASAGASAVELNAPETILRRLGSQPARR